ncbi:MAG: AEC family transporter [Spirochaetales bacterium]|nr:AEC family transporter [Spirochaetales bacterium]
MEELIKRIIPVFLIIFIGYILRRKEIIGEGGVKTLKTLIVSLFLPASLFYAFLNAELTSKYFFLIAGVIIICFLLYLIGLIFRKTSVLDSIYGAEFFTGFEFGMVGIALFSAIFGVKALPVISLIGLGHEFFIWFIYLPLLKSHAPDSKNSMADILVSFVKSPIIIAIIGAIILNKTGLAGTAQNHFITGGILTTLSWFSSVTVSVVLIVLGCSLRFDHLELRRSLKYSLLRLFFVLLIGIPAYFAVKRLIPDLPVLFQYAWLTFFLLPPPYIIPIYVPSDQGNENSFLSNTIVLYTLISLAAFVIYLFINPPLL